MKTFFLIAALLFSVPAFAAWSLEGVCISDATQILDRFIEKFPKFTDTQTINLVTVPAPTFDQVTGQLNFRFWLRPYATGVSALGGQNAMVLPVCVDTVATLRSFPLQDILFVIGIVFAWALGFKSGLMR